MLGKIYYCHLFYGNGTARLVRNQKWRDKGLGIIQDLGPHLMDTISFWFNKKLNFKLFIKNKFENNSFDHAVLFSRKKNFYVNLEMSMCMWKNTLRCDIIGSKGSVHLESLCKWGPSMLRIVKRKFLQISKIEINDMKDHISLEHEYFLKY